MDPCCVCGKASKNQSSREPSRLAEVRGILISIREQDEGAKGPRTSMLHWETLQIRLLCGSTTSPEVFRFTSRSVSTRTLAQRRHGFMRRASGLRISGCLGFLLWVPAQPEEQSPSKGVAEDAGSPWRNSMCMYVRMYACMYACVYTSICI